jgi:hypothetical protein
MKLFALILASVMLVTAQTSSPAPKKPVQSSPRGAALPDGKTILARSAEATGDIDARNSIKTQKLVGKLNAPEAGISGSIIVYRGQRGETYQVMELPGAGKIEVGNNGEVEWERSTLTGPKVRRVGKSPTDLLEPDPTDLTLAERFSKIETAGMSIVDGNPCFTVHLWPNGSTAMETACYDRETFLPVRLEMNGKVPVKLTLGDYRSVGPSKMPFLIETETMGKIMRLEMETITLNEPLPPEAIDLPDEIEKLAFHSPVDVREVEADKDRPTLRHKPKSDTKQ